MRVIRAISNIVVMLLASLWILPLAIHEATIGKDKSAKEWLTGKEWIFS